jgi:hypothetical protein
VPANDAATPLPAHVPAAPALAERPLAIGGVGGSGTRVVAAAAIALGYALGDDLNRALDNLAFTLLFKDRAAPDLADDGFAARVRLLAIATRGGIATDADRALLQALAVVDRGGADRVQHGAAWLGERAARLLASASAAPSPGPDRWGWKEPNTHIVLPRLRDALPGLRYVHVVRNGLDMAFSSNRNQLMFWGERVLGRTVRPESRDALAYWCEVHRRVKREAEAMGSRFLWLDHDALCADPVRGFARLATFLELPAEQALALAPLARPQPTAGRHRAHRLDGFAQDDLDYLREIGHL